jgi:hypothetical protein
MNIINAGNEDAGNADPAAAFGYITPTNWKRVKTRPGQSPYWVNELSGVVSWVCLPPYTPYHKPVKRTNIESYAFAQPPSQSLAEVDRYGVNT